MIPIGLSLIAMLVLGHFVVGPANRSYSWRAWGVLVAFLGFMYLFTLIMSLIVGGFIEGRPVAPIATQLISIAYSAGAALATGIGAGLYAWRHSRKAEAVVRRRLAELPKPWEKP